MTLDPRAPVPPQRGAGPHPNRARGPRRALLALGVAAAIGGLAGTTLLPRLGERQPERASDPAASASRGAGRVHSDSAAGSTAPADSALSASLAASGARHARAEERRTARDPHRIRAAALGAAGLRILVSLADRRLYVLDGRDTLRVARVGIGMDSTLVYRGRVWNFRTPRGVRSVLRKEAEPVWVPPEWHYVEVARERGLQLAELRADRPTVLDDGSRIEVQDGVVGLVRPTVPFTPFAPDEEIIWQGVLYIPPIGTRQRQVAGELGRYRLDLGEGYLIHGTPHAESVGQPSSHGCMRLADDDIAWLHEHVPVGTPVYTF